MSGHPDGLDLVSVVGARPQFIKLAPLIRAVGSCRGSTPNHRIVHTGQHYDTALSAVFFEELDLPDADVELAIGSGSHGSQTGQMLAALETEFLRQRPDRVLVYGDTNSTLAGALAACKLHIPVCHIEAGLRSFDRSMPEELNRRLVDHCSDRLYAPTPTASKNLLHEGLDGRSIQTGDITRDAMHLGIQQAQVESRVLERLDLQDRPYAVLTLHRPVNTDHATLGEFLPVLDRLAATRLPLILPVHPRIRDSVSTLADRLNAIRCIEPLPWLDMLQLCNNATVVLTDSGGLQKEAAWLGVPCLTLRTTTEWQETVDLGVNHLVGRDAALIEHHLDRALSSDNVFTDSIVRELDRVFGNGHAAESILADVLEPFDSSVSTEDERVKSGTTAQAAIPKSTSVSQASTPQRTDPA